MPETLTDVAAVAALLGALDRGEDDALGPLADLLEGDRRVAGLRLMGNALPRAWEGRWVWQESCAEEQDWPADGGAVVPRPVYRRMRGGGRQFRTRLTHRGWVVATRSYPTRSAALLALALAKAEPEDNPVEVLARRIAEGD